MRSSTHRRGRESRGASSVHAQIQLGVALLCLVLTFPAWVASPFALLSAIKAHASILQELASRGASSSYYLDHRARLHDNDLEILLSSGSVSSLCGLIAAAWRKISHLVRHLVWLIWIGTIIGTLAAVRRPADDGGFLLSVSRWPHVDGRFLAAALLGSLGLLSSLSAHLRHRARLRAGSRG